MVTVSDSVSCQGMLNWWGNLCALSISLEWHSGKSDPEFLEYYCEHG